MDPSMDHHDMDMGGMDMAMGMTFQRFKTYKVKVIWDWWSIETKGQYAASVIGVIAAVFIYRGLVKVERRFVRNVISRAEKADADYQLGESLLPPSRKPASGPRPSPMYIPLWARLAHAVLSALLYGYALLLMLAAMAYNAGIFLALMAGWVLGELVFSNAFDQCGLTANPSPTAAACCEG